MYLECRLLSSYFFHRTSVVFFAVADRTRITSATFQTGNVNLKNFVSYHSLYSIQSQWNDISWYWLLGIFWIILHVCLLLYYDRYSLTFWLDTCICGFSNSFYIQIFPVSYIGNANTIFVVNKHRLSEVCKQDCELKAIR